LRSRFFPIEKLRPVITTFLLDFQAEWPDQPKASHPAQLFEIASRSHSSKTIRQQPVSHQALQEVGLPPISALTILTIEQRCGFSGAVLSLVCAELYAPLRGHRRR
jgi:hypothetical protein